MRFFFYLIFLFVTTSLSAQSRIYLSDTEYQRLKDKARGQINNNIDSGFYYIEKIEQSANPLHLAFAFGLKSYCYQLKYDTISANRSYKKAVSLLQKVPESPEKVQTTAYLLSYRGLTNWKRRNFDAALKCYLSGKKLSLQVNDLKQVVKFNNNIAVVTAEAGNYDLAVKAAKESDKYTNQIEYLYSEDEFIRAKCHSNFNLGNFYKKSFPSKRKFFLLDSAEHYLKKAILFSKNFEKTRLNAELSLANVYIQKGQCEKAIKIHHKLSIITKNDKYLPEYSLINRSLGEAYYVNNEYDKALIYLKRVDSIFAANDVLGPVDFLNSNYYQAKIWAARKDYDKAALHSKLYLENFEKTEDKLRQEIVNVNNTLSAADLKSEMTLLKEQSEKEILVKKVLYFVFGLLLIVLVLLYFKNSRDKKRALQKVEMILAAYNAAALVQQNSLPEERTESAPKLKTEVLLSEESEKEIIAKLKVLEEKRYYLQADFTQQEVAKKIKTNTTYLSHVVNKNYGKSFSMYSNELRINYVINEIINNSRYREYTTQAIAESAGFKNGDSFASSFKKKTGVTPYQFINEVKKRELV